MDQLAEPFALRHLNRYALPYRNLTDEGDQISEWWAVPRDDLAAFLGELRR